MRIQREADVAVGGVAGLVGRLRVDRVRAVGQRGRIITRAESAAVDRIGDGGTALRAGDRERGVAGQVVGGGAGGAGARGVVGERPGRSRRAGIQREADGAVGGVAGLVGRLHVNRVQAVGQRGRIITRAEGATVDRIGDGGTPLRAGNRERGVAGQVVGAGAGGAGARGVVGERHGGSRRAGIQREADGAVGGVAGLVGRLHVNRVQAVGQRGRIITRAEGATVDRIGDGGTALRAGNRERGVAGQVVGAGAGGAGARGVVGERHGGSRRAGIQREAAGAVGGVARLVGRLHVNRVQAVGQRGRIITRAEGATVDRIGDGGTALRAGNRERGVAGQVVGAGAGGAGARGVVGERHGRSRRAGIQREADAAVGGVAGLVGRLHVDRLRAVGQHGRIITRAEGATVDRIGDGGTALRAGNRERGVAGQVVGGGAGGAGARGVVGERHGRSRRAGIQREADAAVGGVAGLVGRLHVDRLRAVGQHGRIITRAEGATVDRIGDGGTAL